MNGIDKYMIPLDSIRSVDPWVIATMIFVTLVGTVVVGAMVSLIADGFWFEHAVVIAAVTVTIIAMALAYYVIVRSGFEKRIDTSKINNEYGITVTSMDYTDKQDGVETRLLSYLHDGTMVHGTLIVKDNKAGLLAGTGDKLTPVKPRSVGNASASPTTAETPEPSKPSETTRSRAGCYVKAYNEDGSIKELAGDCATTSTH